MKYVVITGSGRSGTNWLLDMLDASPQTHCRNEPHGIPGTPLNLFPRVWSSPEAGSTKVYSDQWDAVAAATARRFGERDHHLTYPKNYVHPWARRLGATRLVTSPRARRAASRVDRRLAGSEWELPGWMGSRRRLRDSTGVLKIQIDAPLVSWLVATRPHVPIVHIVRHPGGRLSSWLDRWVEPLDSEARTALHHDRRLRIDRIRSFDPWWGRRIPDSSTLGLMATEMWLWRYVNESVMQAGRDGPSYRLVRFDDLAADPVGQAKAVYRHAGLTWSDLIGRRIARDTTTSVFGSVTDSQAKVHAWRARLSKADADVVDDVMTGSELRDLFDPPPSGGDPGGGRVPT